MLWVEVSDFFFFYQSIEHSNLLFQVSFLLPSFNSCIGLYHLPSDNPHSKLLTTMSLLLRQMLLPPFHQLTPLQTRFRWLICIKLLHSRHIPSNNQIPSSISPPRQLRLRLGDDTEPGVTQHHLASKTCLTNVASFKVTNYDSGLSCLHSYKMPHSTLFLPPCLVLYPITPQTEPAKPLPP